jgi:hypothetical protein
VVGVDPLDEHGAGRARRGRARSSWSRSPVDGTVLPADHKRRLDRCVIHWRSDIFEPREWSPGDRICISCDTVAVRQLVIVHVPSVGAVEAWQLVADSGGSGRLPPPHAAHVPG